MINTTLVLMNPDFGFIYVDGQFLKYRSFDLQDATFIHCQTKEELEYVSGLEPKAISFLTDEIEAFPFEPNRVEAKVLMN